jgi:uridine kinase
VGRDSGSIIIGLCGGSGSGKTTLARELADLLGRPRCRVISFDSYYHDLSHMTTEQRAAVNFDAPESLDVGLMASHLDHLRGGTRIGVPVYDFASHTRSGDIVMIEPTDYVIIEGILLFAFEEIRRRLDYRVFIDCPADIRYQRRLMRDLSERGRTEDSVRTQWAETVAPMHDLHVQPFARHAHFLATYGPPAADVAKVVFGELTEGAGE